MASKKQDFNLDPFGFSDELNMPAFNFESPKTKDDRKPITKAAIAVGAGVLGGIKDTTMNPAFVRRLVKESLPQGYGSAVDMAMRTTGTLKNLYNDTVRDVKPVLRDLKRTTAKILPSVEPALPKAVADKIKEWTKPDPYRNDNNISPEQQRDAALQMQLGEIFQFQTKAQLKSSADADAREAIKTGIEHSRHRDMLGQLDAMRVSLQQLTSYQNKVNAGFQRKSLELQYRQYFVAMDALQEQKRQNVVTTNYLADVVKNTGLPDFLKMHEKDRLVKTLRNKFAAGADSVFSKRQDFVKNLGEEVARTVKAMTSRTLGRVQSGVGLAEAAHDLSGSSADMGGPSGAEQAGNLVGGGIGQWVASKVAPNIKRYASKMPAVMRGNNRLNFLNENKEQMLGAYAKSDKHETGRAMFDIPLRMAKRALSRTLQPDNALTTGSRDSAGSMLEPAVFNRGTSKSITEIIPGYLSRIYRELQIMRTGDTKTELTVYDYNKNKFAGATENKRNILKSIVKDGDREGVTNQLNTMLDTLDPRKKLTPEMRKLLGQQLLSDNLKPDAPMSKERMTNPDTYTGAAGKYRDKFADAFEDFHFTDDSGKKATEFARSYRALGRPVVEGRKAIQDHVNTGNRETLEEMGLLTPGSDQINMDQLAKYTYGDEYVPGDIVEAAPSDGLGRPGTKQSRSSARPPSTKRKPRPAAPPKPAPVAAPIAPVENPFDRSAALIVKAIEDASSKTIAEVMSETLNQINLQLQQGIPTHLMEEGAPGEPGARPRFGLGATLGSNIRSAVGGAAWATRKTYGVVQGAITGAFGRALRVGGVGLKIAGGVVGGVGHGIALLKDVYVEGEPDKPRLLAWRIRAGQYLNKETGKAITNYRDISGAVLDSNGNEVMSREEAATCYVKTRIGKQLLSGLGAVFKAVNRTGNALLGAIPLAARASLFVAKKAWGLLKTPQDIYVKGKKDPVMLARTMRAGGYFSRISGKKIEYHGDIDGPVVDDQKNEVLTGPELAQGLYDVNGNRLRTPFARLVGMARGAVAFGLRTAAAGLKAISNTVTRGIVGTAKVAGAAADNLLGAWGRKGSATMIERLTEIRNLLSDRLPKSKKRIIGDTDGDGTRDGSYMDMLRKKRAAAAKEDAELGPDSPSGMGGAGTKFSLMGMMAHETRRGYKKLTGRGDDKAAAKPGEEEAPESSGGMVDTAVGTVGGLAAAKVASQASGGLWNAAKGVGLKGATKGLGIAGAAYSGYSAYQNFKQGNYGSAAVDTALGLGGLAATGTSIAPVIAAAGTALEVGGAVVAGIAGLLSLPVVLGAAALAAAGTGLYYAHKFATKKRLNYLSKVRYAQYGFLPTDEDHLQQVFGLEDELIDQVKYDNGVAFIDSSKLDVKKLLGTFDITLDNKDAVDQWLVWYNNRFKAIYLTHLTALKKVEPRAELGLIENLTPQLKKDYLEIAKFPNGPYNITASPFKDLKALPAGDKEVAAVLSEADAAIAKELKDKPATSKTGLAIAAAPAAAAAVVATTAAKEDTSKLPSDSMFESSSADQMAAIAKEAPASPSGLDDSRGVITAMGVPIAANKFATGQLDALTVIRYKTYGLVTLELDKVRALDTLEDAVNKNLDFGKGNAAVWKGAPAKMLEFVGGIFGVRPGNNNNAYNWLAWFNQRFLPTYLAYLSAAAGVTNKKDPLQILGALTKKQRVDVGLATYSATGSYSGGTVSVWRIPRSPWPDYVLNNDQASVDGQMAGLKELAGKAIVDEGNGGSKTGLDKDGPAAANAIGTKAGEADATDPTKAKDEGFFSKIGNTFSKIGTTLKDAASNTIQGVKDFFTGKPGDATPGGIGAGTPIAQPGNGTGGDINSIPMPKGNGSWAALKDTILAASAMVGVDPKLMATMAAIESGFDVKAKPTTSNALGLYQFVPKTWKEQMGLHARKYGIDPNTDPTDPRANALLGAEYLKQNLGVLKKAITRPITDTDIYAAHFLGGGGASTLLKADPNTNAVTLMPDAAAANPSIFLNPDKSPRTVNQVYAHLNGLVQRKGQQFGLNSGSEAIVASPATPPVGAPTQVVAAAAAGATPASTAPSTTTPGVVPGTMAAMTLTPPPTTVATNAIGVPVSDQTPGLATTAGATPAASPVATNATTPAVDPAVAAIGSGFTTPRSRDIVAQADYQKDVSAKLLGDMGTTLQQSMGIQQSQLDVLQKILGLMGNTRAASSNATLTPATPQATAGDGTMPSRPMPNAPVSMDKPVFA